MTIRFWDRDFSKQIAFPGVRFEVLRMEWELEGGCSKALVRAKGTPARLAQLSQLLRCGVELSGGVWWGFVFAIRSRGLELSLEELANRVAVRYRDVRLSELISESWQYQTGWVQDNASVAEYGKKEMVFHIGEAYASEADAFAAAEVAKRARPSFTPSGSPKSEADLGEGGIEVILDLRGWWSTLGWVFFSEARGQLGFSGGGSQQYIGDAGANTAFAESTVVGASGWSARALFFKVAKEGSPADNLLFRLHDDVAAAPGFTLATATIAGPTLTGEMNWIKGELSPIYGLAAGTTYWVVITRSGAADAANYYRVSVDQGLPYTAGAGLLYNGGAWAARVPAADVPFLLLGQGGSTSQIQNMTASTTGGQFFRSTFIKNASTVAARLYRSGVDTALKEVRAMLAEGDGSGGQLMATVTRERVLVVESVGSSSAPEYLIVDGGEVRRRDGGPVGPAARLCGRWARVQGWAQPGGDAGPAGAVLISRAAWDAKAGKVRVGWE